MKNDPTDGYTAVPEVEPGRILYECNETHRGLDGILRKCSKQYRRYLIPDKTRGKSCKHEYTIEINEPPPAEPKEVVEDYPIFRSLAVACCQTNLSLRQATSESMMSLINTAIAEGFKHLIANPTLVIENLPQFSISRHQLRQQILQLAEKKEAHNIKALKKVKFVVAAIDNGTIHHRHMMFVNIVNPCAGLQSC